MYSAMLALPPVLFGLVCGLPASTGARVYWCVAACLPAVLPPAVLQCCRGVAPRPSTWSVILSVTLPTQIARRQAPSAPKQVTRHCCQVVMTQAGLRHVAPSAGFSVRIERGKKSSPCICPGSTLYCTTDCRQTRQVNTCHTYTHKHTHTHTHTHAHKHTYT